MKNFVSIVVLSMLTVPAMALTPAGQGRRSMSNQMGAAPRATASTNQITAMATAPVSVSTTPNATDEKSSVRVDSQIPVEIVPAVDMREKEKKACLSNNIGIGNTFVWASRYSNLNNYSSMVEDIENPENNTCFVKVEIKSDDGKISVSDIPAQYFEMGRDITCGEWADEGKLKKRILDAKKSARTWATVGGSVGGAAVGVGVMELFGNAAIGGKVQGQKNKKLSESEVLRSQLLAIEGTDEFKQIVRYAQKLRDECEKDIWTAENKRPDECEDTDYNMIIGLGKNK